MTANASSSSDTSLPEFDLLARGALPPVPAALLRGAGEDLVAPMRFLAPGSLPTGPPPQVDRRALAAALGTVNAAYGHPAAAEQAAKLADPRTRVVVTGQQPGLFGGPLLTLTKLIAAARWAAAIEAAGEPAVAVFWVATEDHDWAEVAQATFVDRDGPHPLALGEEDPAPLLPVGMRSFGAPITAALEALSALYPGPLPAERLAPLGRWYRPAARFGEAFCRLMPFLLGARTPLILDAMLSELKVLQQPHLARLVARRNEVEAAYAAANARLEARQLPRQVRPQPGLSPLFLLHGHERRRIAWEGDDAFSLRGAADAGPVPIAQLEETIAENPAAISPGVLARPLIQDAVLGTTLQVLGPAEQSYMAQLAGLYPVLDIEPPWTTLRPQALVLEKRQRAHLAELEVSLGALFDTSVEQLLSARFGEDVVAPFRARMADLMGELRGPITALDATLERPWEKTRGQMDRALEQLAGKAAAASARRHDVHHQRLERILATCRPGGKPQERILTVAHFMARYGSSFVDAFWDQLGLDPRPLHVIEV